MKTYQRRNRARIVFFIRPLVYYKCPVCNWRCNSKSGFLEHLKYNHQLKRNKIKILKPL